MKTFIPFVSKARIYVTRKIMSPLILSLVALLSVGLTDTQQKEATGLVVPEGFTVESVISSDSLSYPMFASFDGSGRLFVFESTEPNIMGTAKMLAEPSYHIRLLEDVDGDGKFEKNRIFAKNIPFPKGGVFYRGSLYVTESPNLVRYTDTNDDGVSDKREVILTGWTLHSNGATLGGPFFGPDGWLYITDAHRGFDITNKENIVLKGKGARIWRCRPDGSGLEAMAGGGFDNSIEIIFMPSGETIGTMTYFIDPQDGQRDALMHWVEGGVYPKPNSVIAEDKMKLTGELMPVMTKMPRVAPSGVMRYRGTGFGAAYQDNLFNAEFNTGRIMRHIVSPDGATFKTSDEIFMKSLSSDSHPTDVLQDADGSMLVVITGGWFIEGCPLSRVAKPDVKGGIYRIRKIGAPIVKDSWGKKINMERQTPDNLVKYLSDPRTAVRDNAIEQLVLRGGPAVSAILKIIPNIKNAEMRAAAVFALSRIESANAMNGVRNALNDKSSMVRTAAVRVLGMNKDAQSVHKLMELVQKDVAPVRRQAATALGQIGDIKAIPALLNAAVGVEDRFIQHVIIHSLIMFNSPDLLVKALEKSSPQIQTVALIALDQMDGAPLQKQHLAHILDSQDPGLRSTGIWIASHHPEWTDVVISFLNKSFQGADLSDSDASSARELMLAFVKNQEVQEFLAKQLGSPKNSSSRKLLMLDVMSSASLKELPKSWIKELDVQLQGKDASVSSQILGLIGSRRIKSLNESLNKIVMDSQNADDFRLKALNARIMSSPSLSEVEFKMLVKYIGPQYDSALRQVAVRLLSHAELNDTQLTSLAQNQIGNTDAFLLPSLMESFEENSNEKVGISLLKALTASNVRLDNLTEPDFQRILKAFPASVHSMAEPLVVKLNAQHAERLAHLQKMEAQLKGGDVGEGRKLFYGKASCYSCHAVGSEGGRFGPDLTNIGEIRSKHDLLEAVLYPSASFAREYETFRVVTKTTAYIGIIKEQLPESIVIEVGPAPGLRIARSEIKSIEPQTLSMMPPGLDQQLTFTEMANLTAFLEALPYRLDRMIQQAQENK